MKDILTALSKLIATVFFVGYLPVAPGTFGSLAGLIFVWMFKPDTSSQIMIIVIGFILGTLASHVAEKAYGEKDCRYIVADEFVGYLLSVVFLPLTAGYMISAFFLFRFFDILKPPPIRNIERALDGGLGIMLDDVAAGIFTNVVLQLWRMIGE